MCLAIPAEVKERLPGQMARVSVEGVEREVALHLVDDVAVGDYVIVHVGFALSKLDPEEARKTLDLLAEAGAIAPRDDAAAEAEPAS